MEQKITVGNGENAVSISIPEGFEIDTENSTFTNIKFKPAKKHIDMSDIIQGLQDERMDNATYLARNGDLTLCVSTIEWEDKHIARVVAYAALTDIASYYNGDWEPNWDNADEMKYFIYYNHFMGQYEISHTTFRDEAPVHFRWKERAQDVISNPNFRKILDTLYK